MEVGSSLYTITNKLSISDCQALGLDMSFRWWSPCLDSDLSPRSFGGHLCACRGRLCALHCACALVAGLLAPEVDATCLIKHYSVNGTRLGHIFGLPKIGAPGRGDVGNE